MDRGAAGEGELGERPAAAFVERFKEAMSYHAMGVTIVAVRDDARIHATTVSSFIPLSVDPPTILVSVGGNAQVLPFLEADTSFTVNLLDADQRRLASVYADSFPVGPSPFAEDGAPVIPEAPVSFVCEVDRVIDLGNGRLVVGLVSESQIRGGRTALVRFRRAYFGVPG